MVDHPKLHITLLTGRTIEQGVGKERGKASKEYMESVTSCFVDPNDLKALMVKNRENVLVSTRYGSVVLKALQSPRSPHRGTIYVPYGPWANALVDPETNSIGMPSYKGIPAEIEPALDKPLLNLDQLLKEQFGKK